MFARKLRWYDPWKEFEALEQALDHFTYGGGTTFAGAARYPHLNYYTHGEDGVVTAEVPGIAPQDIEISVNGRELTISGERKADELGEGEVYERKERWSGKFERTIKLPFNVEQGKVEAKVVHGVLSVTLPRAESEKPRKIAIDY